MKRILGIWVIIALLMSSGGAVSAAQYTDIDGHWAQECIQKWSDYGIIKGYDGLFNPDAYITRGEMAVIIERIMNYSDKSENTFSDLDDNFYTDAVLALIKNGVMTGSGDAIRPNDKITRQETAVMLARAFSTERMRKIEYSFDDIGSVADWAYEYIVGMVNKGYINGSNGRLNVGDNITRAETVKILDNMIGKIYSEKGVYEENTTGISVVSTDGVTIKNCKADGDMIVTNGIGSGSVTLNNVQISGRLIVNSALDSRVILIGSKAGSIETDKDNSPIIYDEANDSKEDSTPPPSEELSETDEPTVSYGSAVSSSKPTPKPTANPDENTLPTIETTLEEGERITSDKKKFEVSAKDKNGERIVAVVKFNGKTVNPSAEDNDNTSYILEFSEKGENKVVITAFDQNNAVSEKTYTVIYEPEETQNIPTSTWSIEAFTVGGGYIAEPVTVTLTENVNCATVLENIIREKGLSSVYSGSEESGYYLSAITNIPNFTPNISDILKSKAEGLGYSVNDTDYSEGELAEFDFTQGSGWMYCVNGSFPNVGMSDYYLQDGDVVRVQFSLVYGADIGGASNMGWSYAEDFFEAVNRDELTKLLAKTGMSKAEPYMNVITKPNATQDEIDTVVRNLSN